MKKEMILTNLEKCIGCNMCVSACPQKLANCIRHDAQNRMVAQVIHENYTACGECIQACTHEARYFVDDLEPFMKALNHNDVGAVLMNHRHLTLILSSTALLSH